MSYISIKYIKKKYCEMYSYSEKLEDFDYFEVRVFWRLYIFKSLPNLKTHYCISEMNNRLKSLLYFIYSFDLLSSFKLNVNVMYYVTTLTLLNVIHLYFLNKSCVPTSFKWDVFLIKMQSSAWVTIVAYTISIFK